MLLLADDQRVCRSPVPLAVVEALLEVGCAGIKPGCVAETALRLRDEGRLSHAEELTRDSDNAARDHAVESLFDAVGRGWVRRRGGRYVATPRGAAALASPTE